MNSVVIIQRHNTNDRIGGAATFCAVATSEESAKRWIQDEVDGKHLSNQIYAEGHTADWWIQYKVFSLTEHPIYDAV